QEEAAEDAARKLARARHIIIVASGADRVAGRELTLKIEEGPWIPSAYRDLETFLHGHLPATGGETGLVLIPSDRRRRAGRVGRVRHAVRSFASDTADQLARHEIDHAQIPGQEVLEHDPLGPCIDVAADHIPTLVGRADDPARPSLCEPGVAARAHPEEV